MYEQGEIVNIDGREYIILDILNSHSINYYYLKSNFSPIENIVVEESNSDFNTVSDDEILKYILERFVNKN